MKTIIAGSREGVLPEHLLDALLEVTWQIDEVVCGGARGADELGRAWAKVEGIPCEIFAAEWDKYGKRAGMVRNRQMALYGDALIALWDGTSKGTHNMIAEARARDLPVVIIYINN